jgi:hypothetical protein
MVTQGNTHNFNSTIRVTAAARGGDACITT